MGVKLMHFLRNYFQFKYEPRISQTHLTSLQGKSLRNEYNKYLANTMAELRLAHPSLSGYEVLAKARTMSEPYIIVIPSFRCVIS